MFQYIVRLWIYSGEYSDDLDVLNRNGTTGNSSGYINTRLLVLLRT